MRTKPPSHSALLVALLGFTAAGCSESDASPTENTTAVSEPSGSDAAMASTPTALGSTSAPAMTGNAPPAQSPAASSTEPPAPSASPTSDNSQPTTTGPSDPPPGLSSAEQPSPVPSSSADDGGNPPTDPGPDATDDPDATGDMPTGTPPQDTSAPDDETGDDTSDDLDDTGDGPDDTSDAEMFGPDIEGACTPSEATGDNAQGSGPYEVVIETNGDPAINEGTLFRPATLGDEIFPIFVWGQGGCSLNGLSNSSAMAEIASHGYFVIADGTPNGSSSRSMDSNDVPGMGEPLLAYIDWALTENSKPCSAYYHALDASKIAANGFSCGGLMSTGTAGDPRITTWGSTSSGTFSEDQALYDSVHTPVLIISGGPSDIAYENGARDYQNISEAGHPIMYFSKDIGHGGDLFQSDGGDFTKINLAWLNWWLKGDESETGKGVLVGAGCSYCSDSAWEVKSANLP